MSKDSIDALGYQSERYAAFTSELLSEVEDAELTAIVEEAAKDLGTPIALVNLVLEQIQFFKAHYGLPPDLALARGTNRDVSFCQFVVREGEPFEVNDAEQDDRVPQHLVKHYGIRAYLGMPIMANDTIVGSLCVIDTKPRQFSESDRRNLRELAIHVNARLAILQKQRDPEGPISSDQITEPALDQIRKTLQPIEKDAASGRIASAAISAFLRLMEYSLEEEKLPPAVIRQTLRAAQEALDQCQNNFHDIEGNAGYADRYLAALEQVLQNSKNKVPEKHPTK